ncbi:uncharacterized protein [Oscarella lobularis]
MAEPVQNERRDDPALPEPQKRDAAESAVVDGHLYLFGGWSITARGHLVRNEIWTMNVGVGPSPRRWIRRLAGGRTIPPACNGARCVVVDEMIYSYGGQKPDGGHLGIVYRLDPKKMEWIEVATPIEENCPAPPPRANCCLCSIGSRLVMFGGRCCKFPRDRLQCGAMEENWWTNDVYEFELDKRRESGRWLGLELSGQRPRPLQFAAMAAIDRCRAFLFGMDIDDNSYSVVLNLYARSWSTIDFDVKPHPRFGHTICQWETEEKSLCVLVGGCSIRASGAVYVLDIDGCKAHK